jgi:hypothetical protein
LYKYQNSGPIYVYAWDHYAFYTEIFFQEAIIMLKILFFDLTRQEVNYQNQEESRRLKLAKQNADHSWTICEYPWDKLFYFDWLYRKKGIHKEWIPELEKMQPLAFYTVSEQAMQKRLDSKVYITEEGITRESQEKILVFLKETSNQNNFDLIVK